MATTTKLVELFNADETIAALSTQAFVEAAYENLLGLSGDFSNKDARVAYWVAKIDAGLATADFAATFLAAAAVQGDLLTDAEFAVNTATLVAVAALDETDLTLAAVKAAAVAAVEESETETETPDANAGETFTLTAGAETVTGTAGDDTIEATLTGLTSTKTFDASDVIDGGEGEDTLKVAMTADFTGMTSGTGSVTNVEVIDIANGSALTRNFDTTGMTGIETVNIDTNDQAFNLKDLESTDLTVNISNADDTKTVALTYATLNGVAVNAGTSDSLTLGLNDVGTAAVAATTTTSAVAEKVLSVTAADVEALTIVSNGEANFVDASIGNATSITISGDADLKLSGDTAVDATVAQVDGSAATGDLNLNLKAATGLTSVVTSSGDDTVTLDAMGVEATLTGGEGADTLVLSDLAAGTYQPTMTGFETIKLVGQSNAITVAGGNSSGLAEITILEGLAGAVTTKFAEFGSQEVAINFTDTKDTADVNNAGTVEYTSAADLTINATTNNTAGTTTTYDDNVTAATATSLEVNIAKDVIFTGAVTAASATSADINVTKGGSYTTGALTVASAESVTLNVDGTMSSAVAAAKAGTVTVNAGSASAFSSQITAAKATTVNVTSADTDAIALKLDTAKATSVSINTKSNTSVGGTTDLSAVASLTLVSTGDVDLSGASAALGDDASSLTIDASEVKGDLTIDTTAYAAGGGALTVTGSTLGANDIDVASGRNEIAVTGGIDNDTVKLAQVFTSSDEVSMSFSLGSVSTSDSVQFASGSDITNGSVTFSGVDTVTALGTLAIGGSALHEQTLTVSSAGAITVAGSASADTVDLSSVTTAGASGVLTFNAGAGNDVITGLKTAGGAQTLNGEAGNDTITLGAAAATVEGGAGNDTITLGAAADTVKFADTAANNGADVVTGFGVATADTLDFDAFLTTAQVNTTGTDFVAAGLSLAAGNNVGFVYNKSSLTSSDIVITASAAAGKIDIANDSKNVVFVNGDADGTGITDNWSVYYVEDTDATAAVTATVTLVGTITVNSEIDTIGEMDGITIA